MTDAFLARWQSSNAELHRDGQTLVISALKSGAEANPDRSPLQLSLNDLPVKKDHGLLIQFEVQSEKLRDFAADVPRIISATPSGLPGWPEKKKQPRALLGWSTSQDFTPVSFYFRIALMLDPLEVLVQTMRPICSTRFKSQLTPRGRSGRSADFEGHAFRLRLWSRSTCRNCRRLLMPKRAASLTCSGMCLCHGSQDARSACGERINFISTHSLA